MLQVSLILAIAALVGLDQLFKWLAVTYLKDELPFVLIDNVLEFKYLENRGAAFGILENCRWLVLTVTSIALVLLLALLLSGKFRRYKLMNISGILIVAGGIGNMIDRIAYGYVVDFIYVKWINFPIFNFADCCVVIGAVMLLVFFFFFYEEQPKKKGEAARPVSGDTVPEAETVPKELTMEAVERRDSLTEQQEEGSGADGEENLDRSAGEERRES